MKGKADLFCAFILLTMFGCISNSVSYCDAENCLIVRRRDFFLAPRDLILRSEKIPKRIVLERGSHGWFRRCCFVLHPESSFEITCDNVKIEYGARDFIISDNYSSMELDCTNTMDLLVSANPSGQTVIKDIENAEVRFCKSSGRLEIMINAWQKGTQIRGGIMFVFIASENYDKDRIIVNVLKAHKCEFEVAENWLDFGCG